MKRRPVVAAAFVLAFSAISQSAQAQQPPAKGTVSASVKAADENAAAIKKSAQVFAEAFNHGDAKAIDHQSADSTGYREHKSQVDRAPLTPGVRRRRYNPNQCTKQHQCRQSQELPHSGSISFCPLFP